MPSAMLDRQYNMNASWRPPPHNEIISDQNDDFIEWTTPSSNQQPQTKKDPNAEGAYLGGPLKMPGYVYWPKVKKYFKLPTEHSGIRGNNGLDKAALDRRNRQREEKFAANRPRFISGSFVQRPVVKPLNSLMAGLEIGGSRLSRVQRHIDEMKLLNHTERPSFTIRNPINESGHVVGCEFLDVNEEGNRIVGSFPIGNPYTQIADRKYSSVYVFEVETNDQIAREETRKMERRGQQNGFNTMGLVVQPVNSDRCEYNEQYAAFQFEDFIVDQTLAKLDTDITCMLTVTAADRMNSSGAVTSESCLHINPVVDISNPDCKQSVSCAPIYNARWKDIGAIWSVGFNEKMMGISLGMEDHFRIHDIVADKGFNLSSKKRNVISHSHSADGNIVIMGLRGDDLIRSDFRMKRGHITGSLKGTRSTSFVKMLKTAHPDCFIAEGFDNKAGLWDLRFSNRPLLSFKGHRNQHYKLSCFVDPKERFFLAVGDDGVTRGWSLMSGDMLCSIKSPRPEMYSRIHFPRVVYSDSWGGKVGNSAVVVAVGDTIRVHHLDI